jgi:hypothetical protein
MAACKDEMVLLRRSTFSIVSGRIIELLQKVYQSPVGEILNFVISGTLTDVRGQKQTFRAGVTARRA